MGKQQQQKKNVEKGLEPFSAAENNLEIVTIQHKTHTYYLYKYSFSNISRVS